MDIKYFETAAELRQWFEKNHDKLDEVQIGFFKKKTGKKSITYNEAVDQALCFGWIDGVRNTIDDERHVIRFTPRRPKSNWSAININKVQELIKAGLMHPSGLKAFNERDLAKTNQYSHEALNPGKFDEADEQLFRANEKAWQGFMAMPPSYRKAAIWWVVSAKQEATRKKRLLTLIEDSAQGRKVKPLTRKNER